MNLYMTIDFLDDMIPSKWNRERLANFMKMNAQMGVKRICWIYHGDRYDGFWENTAVPWTGNIEATFDALGSSYLKTAVEEAHKVGLEIFAVYKPFELAIHTYPSREACKTGKLPVVGGTMNLAFNFAVENQDALMRRRNTKITAAKQIILQSTSKLTSEHKFRLWASNDNWEYQPIEMFHQPSPDGFSIFFDVSGETAKYYAIENISNHPVENRLDSIIKVIDIDGNSVQHTLGLEPRKYRTNEQNNHLGHCYDIGGGFSKEGFNFDYIPGIPSGVNGHLCLDKNFNLADNTQNVIGIALEVNDYVPGAPEPAEPIAVDYWLSMLKKALSYGVDGVDIRITNHNSIVDWTQYGFNKPVVDEYKKRYGINPQVEDYNKEALRRLRGEYYTAFLEEAKQVVHKANKKLSIHIPNLAFNSPDKPTMMEIHWDWRTWLEKGIPDEVTFKSILIDETIPEEGIELIQQCKQQEVPISICPFLHAINDIPAYIKNMKELGIDAFIAYESATIWTIENNRFKELNPAINRELKNVTETT